MINTNTTRLDIAIRNEELAACKDQKGLELYINEVVLPLIENAITVVPKDAQGSLGLTCDRSGCTVIGEVRIKN